MEPHEQINAFVSEVIGARAAPLGPLGEELMELAVGLSDQLSRYHQLRPTARITVRGASFREGAERAYLFISLRANGGPLRMQSVLANWDQPVDSSNPLDWVYAVNARRWQWFVRSRAFLDRLFTLAAEALVAYYEHRPQAWLGKREDSMVRIMETCDSTYLVLEFDDHSIPATREAPDRHKVPT